MEFVGEGRIVKRTATQPKPRVSAAQRKAFIGRMAKFEEWLVARGAEMLKPTNEWELMRFRANGITSIWYRNAKEEYRHTGEMATALAAFTDGQPWRGIEATKRVAKPTTEVRTLLARDGEDCFLCGKPLGEDITTEHLVAVTHGGPNHLSNKVLTHAACNRRMNHMPAMAKVRLRESIVFATEAAL